MREVDINGLTEAGVSGSDAYVPTMTIGNKGTNPQTRNTIWGIVEGNHKIEDFTGVEGDTIVEPIQTNYSGTSYF